MMSTSAAATLPIDRAAFEARLVREGYLESEVKVVEAGKVNGEHSHDFDVLALVLDGEATIACGPVPQTFRAGDIVEVAAGVVHTEHYGPQGYTFLVGRRRRA
ncbi:MAG: cupin [Burkholderiales bacterium]|nr:cupin [Burkholderiales bacterium]